MTWIKTHPFWMLLIVLLVILMLQLVFIFAPGHGSGGMDVGPIQQDE